MFNVLLSENYNMLQESNAWLNVGEGCHKYLKVELDYRLALSR